MSRSMIVLSIPRRLRGPTCAGSIRNSNNELANRTFGTICGRAPAGGGVLASARNDLCVWPEVAQQSQIARTKRLACDTGATAEMKHIPGSVGRSVGMTGLPSEICVHETHLHFLACPRTFFVREHQRSVCSRTNEQKWTNFAYVSSFLVVFFAFSVFVNTARNKFSLCSRTKKAFPFSPPNSGGVVSRTDSGRGWCQQKPTAAAVTWLIVPWHSHERARSMAGQLGHPVGVGVTGRTSGVCAAL